MLKPFFIKKKNIDNRLLPAVTAADVGKVFGVTEDGKVAAVEDGGTKKMINIPLTDVEFGQIFAGTPLDKTISSSETANLDDETLTNVIITVTREEGVVIFCNYAVGQVASCYWGNVVTFGDTTAAILQIARNFEDATNVVTISLYKFSIT